MIPDKELTDDVLDEIIAGARTSMEQYLALSLKAEREAWRQGQPTDDERIMAIEGIIPPISAGNSPVIQDGYVMVPKDPTRDILDEFDSIIDYGAEDSEDAWRRLLAAAPQDTSALNSVQSVVAVSDTWIPVSERMPEVGVKVLCFPVEDEPIHASFNGQLWLQDISWSVSDEIIDNVISCNVTHWMPLPAAPQEVKGE